MKLLAEFIFPSLGKIDKRLPIEDPERHIFAPIIERTIVANLPLQEPDLSLLAHGFKVMEFAFNGRQYPEHFVLNGMGGIEPEEIVFEFEFVGFKIT